MNQRGHLKTRVGMETTEAVLRAVDDSDLVPVPQPDTMTTYQRQTEKIGNHLILDSRL